MWHGQDGWRVQLLEAHPWWVALEKLAVPAITTLTRHLFCCNIPEAAFGIPLGAAHYVDDYMTNSLGSKMFDIGQWINQLGTLGHIDRQQWIPISDETARRLDPEFFAEIQSILFD